MNRLAAVLVLAAISPAVAAAQGAVAVGRGQSPAATGAGLSLPETLEAIARARVVTRILYVTAHPDDESSSVLTYLARGLGADVALLSITRGEGGQNALGPEQGPQLGILRTDELLAATRQYGVRLYFTRAPDFGYSKSPEETLAVWGETAMEDMVRVIRSFRPHVIINHWAGARTGHGHHQAAGILTPRAYEAAGTAALQQQSAEGLKPWRAAQLLRLARREASTEGFRVPSEQVSPLWGKSYAELGREGFLNHRTQGIAGFLGAPFLRLPIHLVPAEGSKFDPAILAELLPALAGKFPAVEGVLRPALEKADQAMLAAGQAALRLAWAEAAHELARAGRQIAELMGQLAMRPATEAGDALWELEQVRTRLDAALTLAAGVRVEAQADRSELVAGESFSLRVESRCRPDVGCAIEEPRLVLPAGWVATKAEADAAGGLRFSVGVSQEAKPLASPRERVEPSPLSLVRARVRAAVDGYAFEAGAPAVTMRASSTRLDMLPLVLVPAVTLALEPRQFVVLEKRPPKQLEVLARVHHYGTAAAEIVAGLEVPEGWSVSPPEPLKFTGAGDQLVRFAVTPPARRGGLAAGAYLLKAYARFASGSGHGKEIFQTSLEPLPTLPTRLWSEPAVAAVQVFDAVVPENLRVGYVAAENDPIPETLRQIGIRVELLDEVALAFSDLSRFDAIAIGIRAYELRRDLGRANQRLLDFVGAGGTLLVQYQRESVWNNLRPAPYPASIGQGTGFSATRVADESSPVRLLVADHPVLNFPNKIGAEDFDGWVQERGLYFWSQFDPRYQPVLALHDPGEEESLGGLLYARHDKGVYIYTGLTFFRQLPAGVPGAYRLFVNLLSQAKAK